MLDVQVPWPLILALTAGVGPELRSAVEQANTLSVGHARCAHVTHCQTDCTSFGTCLTLSIHCLALHPE